MEYNEKLSHLTPDQIDDIVRMYSDKTFKVADIISKYNIDVPVTSFIKILPPIKTDKICEYCGEPLYRNVTARINSFYTRPSDIFCLACGHHVYDEQQYGQPPKCTCEGCKEREQQERARKQELTRKRYERNHTQIQFKDLELGDQIKFIYVLYNNPEQLHGNAAFLTSRKIFLCINGFFTSVRMHQNCKFLYRRNRAENSEAA